ncbi:hypothetical protein [Umezawaea sp. NPDC059074]|uniref:hypothetical protein n=1 Tax=Umezawaea sp. NPDC059074 TaxID=3346716 RepID=UPI0036A3A427
MGELIKEMRQWLKRVDWDHALQESASELAVLRAVERMYTGGVRQFASDSAGKWAREFGWEPASQL